MTKKEEIEKMIDSFTQLRLPVASYFPPPFVNNNLAYGKSVSFWKGEEQQSPPPRKGEAISKLLNDRSTLDSSDWSL